MADYGRHSRFFFSSYREIQDHINAGTVNQWDIVLCSDTQEMLLVTDDFSLVPIQSRVYRFSSVASAESFLNSHKDTYPGQIISVLSSVTGSYQAYMVNQRSNGTYYIQSISVYNSSDLDYNTIGNRPIDNIGGTIEDPVVLSELEDGMYKIKGAYKISDQLETVFQNINNDLITIDTYEDGKAIKVISSSSITDYFVDEEKVTRRSYITDEWIKEQGYLTDSEVDAKLQALNIITRDNALEYIRELVREGVESVVYDVVDEAMDATFNEKFDLRLSQKLVMEDQENIENLFN